MIAYEIKLWYVIRDKIQPETNFFFARKKTAQIWSQTEFCLGRCLRFPVCFFKVVSDKSMLIITKRYILTAIITKQAV